MFGKRTILLLFVLVMAIFVFGGCSQSTSSRDEIEIGEWSIEIEVAGKESVNFTNVEAVEVGPVEFKAAQKDGDDVKETQNFTGILLTDLLEYVGVTEFTVISVESADGNFREMPQDRLTLEGTGIAWGADGKNLDADTGPVQFVADQRGEKWWIKKVNKIFVVE